MHRKLALISTVAIPVVLLVWMSTARAQDEGDTGLLGSWVVTVTPTSGSVCGGGAAIPIPPPFTELVTYNAGGGFLETNTDLNWNVKPLFPGVSANASDGLGTWKKRGSQTQVSFTKLLFNAGSYFADVHFTETSEISDERRLSGKFAGRFDFLQGGPSLCVGGEVTGTPIRPE